jgi:hypothetical protein
MNTITKKKKENYVAPETISVRLISERFLCNSDITGIDSERIDYGPPQILSW